MKKTSFILIALILSTFSIVACNKQKNNQTSTVSTAESAQKAQEQEVESCGGQADSCGIDDLVATPAANKNDAASESVIKVDPIGVESCDIYVAKYAACIKKMPSEAQAAAEQGLKDMASGWRDAATNEAAKHALDQACKQAHAAVKMTLASFQCEW